MRSEMRRLMEACIDRLPEAFRTVFMLRAVEELSVEEIAAAFDIPEATVRTRYFRARGLLREGLSRDIDLAIGDAFSFAGARCDRIVASVLAKLAEGRGRFPVMSPSNPGDCHVVPADAQPDRRTPDVPRPVGTGAFRRRGRAACRQTCAGCQGR